jgi:hypothetical protein
MLYDLAMNKQNAPRSCSTRVADCSIWKLPSGRAGATARSVRCVQGVRQQRCQPGGSPEDEYRQRWQLSDMVMLLSRLASVGEMPYPFAARNSLPLRRQQLLWRGTRARATEERACR